MVAVSPSKYMVQAGWSDVPHLTEAAKEQMLRETPPHLRDARSKGEPTLGSGNVYPIPISDIECRPFDIDPRWKRAYALDVGWNVTAAIWGAQHPADGTIYLYAEHYKGQQLPMIHAGAIKARGEWIRGAIDPASAGRGQRDGKQVKTDYISAGLHLVDANNTLSAGISRMWEGLAFGRIKVFNTLQNFKGEYRAYQYDEHGKIKEKQADHLMDAARYLIMTWDQVADYPKSKDTGRKSGITVASKRAGY